MAEYRISIYGRNRNEWDKLAKWITTHRLFSDNVRWVIQFPRLYNVYKGSKIVNTFEDIIKSTPKNIKLLTLTYIGLDIFEPLFEVTQDPSTHPELYIFLQRVVAFDSVDDESKAERRIYKKYPYPKNWTSLMNPPYSYYLYYTFANLCSLNRWRQDRDMSNILTLPGRKSNTD